MKKTYETSSSTTSWCGWHKHLRRDGKKWANRALELSGNAVSRKLNHVYARKGIYLANCVHCGMNCSKLHEALAEIFGGSVGHCWTKDSNTLRMPESYPVGLCEIWHSGHNGGIRWELDNITNHMIRSDDYGMCLELSVYGGKVNEPPEQHAAAIKYLMRFSDLLEVFEDAYEGITNEYGEDRN